MAVWQDYGNQAIRELYPKSRDGVDYAWGRLAPTDPMSLLMDNYGINVVDVQSWATYRMALDPYAAYDTTPDPAPVPPSQSVVVTGRRQIASLNPASVLPTTQTTIIVNGTNFTNTDKIDIGGVSIAATYVSPTQVTFVLPNTYSASTLQVSVVVSPDFTTGNILSSPTKPLTVATPVVTKRSITSLSPSSMVANTAGTITVTGDKFVNGDKVMVGSNTYAATFVSQTQLTFALPGTYAAGSQNVRVVVPPGFASGDADASTTVPLIITAVTKRTISGLSPASIPATTATTVTINGTNFVNGDKVSIDGAAGAAATFVSATQLTFSANLAAGTHQIAVTPTSGVFADPDTSTQTPLTAVSAKRTISSLSPSSVAAPGSGTLTVNGTNFVSGDKVMISGTAYTATFVSATQLTVPFPTNLTAGSVNVYVVVSPNFLVGDANASVLSPLTVTGAAAAYPDASNTGPTAGLTNQSGDITISANNTTISGKRLTNGMIRVNNKTGCIIQDCEINSQDYFGIDADNTNTIVRRCKITGIGGQAGILVGAGSRVSFCDVSGYENGILFGGNDIQITDNYVHDLASLAGSPHYDGMQTGLCSNVLIQHNTILNGDTSNIFVKNEYAGNIGPITINNNKFGGGPGFNVYLDLGGPGGGISNVSITNNTGARGSYGDFSISPGVTNVTNSGNTLT